MFSTAQDALKSFIGEELREMFKSRGYRKSGLAYHRRVDENFAVVQFQRSQRSSASLVDFTVNLGVFSALVQREVGKLTWVPEVRRAPTESACHLRLRIGSLMTNREDRWWKVDTASARPGEAGELIELLEQRAFPLLEKHVTDEGLRDYWSARETQLRGPEALGLLVLYRDLGARDAVEPLWRELRETAQPSATGYIDALEKFAATMGYRRVV